MAKKDFKNFRDPVVYVLNQELRKRNLRNKVSIEPGWDGELIQYPVELIRDSNKKVTKIIYATGADQWSQKLIRDGTGKIYQVKTTFPDSSTETIQINRFDNVVNTITEV
ncbi:hypothetical protein HBE96_06615 [Clostridium sp. P21]|uniref:Uncharacterized protein n=1 Tax=Clostridium muellerianum TaxID=2716538 RepID=A0A7Y0EH53_9CLOT|nr:hypothetical protein [Clostridium muellerianum]NMM62365.1 hypothetical protein [Clostridium muellerianum]